MAVDQSPPKKTDDVAVRAGAINDMLRAWLTDCIHNSPVSRDVDAMNHITNVALPNLASRILNGV